MRGVGVGLLVVLGLVVAGGIVNYMRVVPAPSETTMLAHTKKVGSAGTLSWPAGAEGALGVVGIGVLAQTPSQSPQPTASVAKVMTALIVLRQKPLSVGQQAPVLTITSADVATYQSDLAQDESTVPVVAGEQISEYQALQGMLIAGGNNMAELLAAWAFGSLATAVAAMNTTARALDMTGTHFADASGFAPQTVSMPADLVRLGEAAMQVPVIADIVKQPSATLPVAGEVRNVDTVIGQSGIVGIKTGSSDQQAGAFLFAAPVTVTGSASKMVVGVVIGAPNIGVALNSAPGLVQAAGRELQGKTIVGAGEEVARLEAPWGTPVPIRTRTAITLVVWHGQTVEQTVTLRHISAPVQAGQRVGTVTVRAGNETITSPVVAGAALDEPPWLWRATRRPPFVPRGDWP